MKRITVVISPNEEKILNWMIEETTCTITDALRIALDLVGENFNSDMLLKYYIDLKSRDRKQSKVRH